MVNNNFALRLQQAFKGYQDTSIIVVQNDTLVNILTIKIYNGATEIDYSQVASGTITFLKDDGNTVQGELTINASNITYTMGTNEIAIPGQVRASIQLYGSSGERLTPARFRFKVDGDLADTSAIDSTTYLTVESKLTSHLADYSKVTPPSPNNEFIDIKIGYHGNAIASNLFACTIGGGGTLGRENVIGGNPANVGTSNSNTDPMDETTEANYSVIGGGYDNVANGLASVITGFHCYIKKEATHGTISGGSVHKIEAGDYNTISGGTTHTIDGGIGNTIGGGQINQCDTVANFRTVGGGEYNVATATGSTIAGGLYNTAVNLYSCIGGGYSNNVTGDYSSVLGGQDNEVSNSYSAIIGGKNNSVTATLALVGCGESNIAAGAYSAIFGGYDNKTDVSGTYSQAMGRSAYARSHGQIAHAYGKFAAQGDAQESRFVLRNQTTDENQHLIGLNGEASTIQIPVKAVWYFKYTVIAKRADAEGEEKAWTYEGLLENNTGVNAAAVGVPVKTTISSTANTDTWDISLVFGVDSISLQGTAGQVGKTINWVAFLQTVEVIA